MERDESEITGARISAINCAREWMQRLVKHGATPEQITEAIQEMAKQAKDEAVLCLSRRDAGGASS